MKTQPRTGKIASLPESIRSEVNRRLLDGQTGAQILEWLNKDKTALLIMDERFNAEPISHNNLSEWRRGGFRDWLKSNERVDQTKALAGFAADLARSNGGRLAEGAQAIAGGRILSILEATGGNMDLPSLQALLGCLSELRQSDIQQQRVDQDRAKIKQKDSQLKLDREKFELLVCGKLLDAAKQARIREIAESGLDNQDKIAALRKEFFSDVDALEKSGEVKIPD